MAAAKKTETRSKRKVKKNVPEGIVFANIDNETGKLASATSKNVVRQAFIENTEPNQINDEADTQEDRDFYKEDLSE